MDDTFSDLPDALVRDLLAAATPLAEQVSRHLDELRQGGRNIREAVQSMGLIRRKADLDVTREPSAVGIDGSYQVHRLTALDLCATAAVAVEGTSKEARRHWQEPHHRMWVNSFEHSKDATNALRGLMVTMELELAHEVPHDLVLLDGSFVALLIYLNQGLTSFNDAPVPLREEFQNRWTNQRVLEQFLGLLQSDRSVAVPKYSGRNELQSITPDVDVPDTDGKTWATMILEPDEYIAPLPIFQFGGEDREYHLPELYCPAEVMSRINASIEGLRVVFFRPYGWAPAVRLELTAPIAASTARLSMVLEGVKRQFFSPAVMEPYPLFLADRMVKSLGRGVNVIEQTVAQQAVGASPDVESTLLCLQNYRTEGGRGGT